MIPTGLGDSTTDIDISVLAGDGHEGDGEGDASVGDGQATQNKDEVEVIEEEGTVPNSGESRKRLFDEEFGSDSDREEDERLCKKTIARAVPLPSSTNTTSMPINAINTPTSTVKNHSATTPALGTKDNKSKNTKKTKVSEFAELAQTEEITQRERVSLAKVKVESQHEERGAKAALMKQRIEIKAVKYKTKADLHARKIDQEQELKKKEMDQTFKLQKKRLELEYAKVAASASTSQGWQNGWYRFLALFFYISCLHMGGCRYGKLVWFSAYDLCGASCPQ